MSAFKDTVAADRAAVFLSMDEFADEHTVDGVQIVCVIDSDNYAQRAPEVGVESADMRLFAPSDELQRKEAGDVMDIDGTLYVVVTWADDMGMAEVALSAAHTAY